jgi:trehalose 6-phosphate phosphatase
MLPTPRTDAGRDGLATLLAAPATALLALDFDGTLSPIVDDPAQSRLAPGGHEALLRLAGVLGTLASVTGRPAAVVVELGQLADIPGVVVAGQYGAERWYQGELHVPDPPAGLATVRAILPGILADAPKGVWVEDKGLSLVVHTRPTADPAGVLAALSSRVRRLASGHGLEANDGRYVLEIRPPGVDKGGALRALVAEFSPGVVAFGGDDLGDLPAYEAVDELRRNGTPGLTIASASAEVSDVADRADLVVDGPAGVVAFLDALAASLP